MHNAKDCCRYNKDDTEEFDFCTTKKGGQKLNLMKQSFAQLSKKMYKHEKTIEKHEAIWKKHCHSNSDSSLEWGTWSGSIGKVVMNLVETLKKTKITPPSPMKATPNIIASNNNEVCPTSVCDADDISVMTSSQDNK
jgi:hypothetical protein